MAQLPNIMWLLVDSVRTYAGTGDDRDRLPFMDEFAREGVEFTNVTTSAPSTVMAISALMSAVPAYVLARNYEDFRFDRSAFKTMGGILTNNNYEVFGLFRHPATREKFLHTIFQPRKDRWLPHLSHIDWWSNKDISDLSRKLVSERDPKKPLFIFHHYNCRKDPEISNLVKEQYEYLKAHGVDADNTIYILCSDHGYPDPQRGYSPELFKQREMTHDMLMSNDNIQIPLIIKYPGCPAGTKIATPISSLDVLPTILDVCGLKSELDQSSYVRGVSLLPLINEGENDFYLGRYFRSDSRLMLQDNRMTSISNGYYKYVYLYDEPASKREQFFDLVADPYEHNNIINSQESQITSAIKTFRQQFEKEESQAVEFQRGYLEANFAKSMQSVLPATAKNKILVLGNVPQRYLSLISDVVPSYFVNSTVTIVGEKPENVSDKITFVSTIDAADKTQEYDLVLILLPSRYALGTRVVFSRAKQIPAKQYLALDYNMSAYSRKNFIRYKFLSILDKKQYIADEPRILFIELKNILKSVLVNVKREMGLLKAKS